MYNSHFLYKIVFITLAFDPQGKLCLYCPLSSESSHIIFITANADQL